VISTLASWVRIAGYLWAGPITLLALVIGLVVRLTGGTCRWRAGVLEVYGGAASALLRLHPVGKVVACTLGHGVVARDRPTLEASRAHELEHVRQFARWGVLFPVLYLLESAGQWLRGRHPYADNRFERAACAAEGDQA
jgi:hypothetical protein